MNKRYKWVANPDIIESVISGTGFSVLHRICELIDGSIDAKASKVWIEYGNSKKFGGKKTLINIDNGIGFEHPPTGIPTIIGDFGAKPTDRIGKNKAYGVGTRGAIGHTIKEGGEASVDSNDGDFKARFGFNWNNGIPETFPYSNPEMDTKGTKILLDGIDTDITVAEIKSQLSVKYYWRSKQAKGEHEGIDIYVNGKPVVFHDPFFRWLDEIPDVFYSITKYATTSYGKYRIRATHMVHKGDNPFQELSDVSDHLSRTPFEYNDGLKPTNSGIYILRNGRYLSHGDCFFGMNTSGNVRKSGHNLNGIRIEIENIKPSKENPDGLEFGTINKSKTQMKEMMNVAEHKPVFDTISKLVTKLEKDYKRITGVTGDIIRQNKDVIIGRINNEIGNTYGEFLRESYVDVEFVDIGERPIYSINGTMTSNGHKSVHYKVPEDYRNDTDDNNLVDVLTKFTLFIHDNNKEINNVR